MSRTAAYKGSILIIVIWALFMLSSFALILSGVVRQRLALMGRFQDRDKLHYIAEAGIKKAISEVKSREQKVFDTLADYWADNAPLFANIQVGDGAASVSYSYYDDISGGKRTRYGFIDEERKININKADDVTLQRLLRVILNMEEQEAAELASAVIDWRDSDNTSQSITAGAEDNYYLGLDGSYEAKDADFEVPEELVLVKGIDKIAYEMLKDYVTIYGDGKVNINTASLPVLMAAGLSREMADKVVIFRCGEDEEQGSADDNAFETPSEIVPLLSQHFHLSPSQIAELSAAANNLGVASGHFTIISNAQINNKKATQKTACVVNKDGKILYWRED